MTIEASANLPLPVQRHVDAAFADRASPIETLVMKGRGRVRIGRLPWMPIDARMYHRIGSDYVGLIRLQAVRIPILSVTDAYVDGAGITKIGPAASIGPEIDQGAFLGMWAAAIGYPSSWVNGVRWESVDEDTARVRLPFKSGEEVGLVRYDRRTGMPVRFEADRHRAASGPKIRWYGDVAAWRAWDGIRAPRRVTAWWADQPAPWFEMTVERVRANVDVDEAMNVGRRAIEEARRRQARSR